MSSKDKMFTRGAHHIGLTVSKLEESSAFFTELLGWKEVKRKDDYPAIFVSDGNIMVTLWKSKVEPSTSFDKNRNIGLHHIAFKVDAESDLNELYQKLVDAKIEFEFSPELLGTGPARHMMCFEPSGIRVEFIWPGN